MARSERQAVREASLLVALVLAGCGSSANATEATPSAPAEAEVSSRPPEAASVATLLGTTGDVRVRRQGEVSWTAVSAGDPLYAGDAVQTMEDARAILRFTLDGVQSELDETTTLVIPESTTEVARLTQLSGRLIARVEAGAGPDRLEVVLPPGTLVLDTARLEGELPTAIEARVDVTDERTDISVSSGRAFLDRGAAPELQIDEGRFTTIGAGGEVLSAGFSGDAITLHEPVDGATLRTRGRVRFSYTTDRAISDAIVRLTGQNGWHEDLPGGRSEAATELASGEYTWTVVGERDGEPARSGETRSLVVVVDVDPPPLSLATPSEGATIATGEVTIRGATEAGARIEIDGVGVPVEPDGAFRATRPLPRGLTNLVIRARDGVGNSRVVSRSVVRP